LAKLFIYSGIFLGSMIGAYLPVIIFHESALGSVSIAGGIVGSFIGLWAGYKAYQSYGD